MLYHLRSIQDKYLKDMTLEEIYIFLGLKGR
jgi:hypothetical protein